MATIRKLSLDCADVRFRFAARQKRFSPVFLAGLDGLMLDSIAFGGISARYNRRPVICLDCFTFGLFAQLASLATTLEELIAITASEMNNIKEWNV